MSNELEFSRMTSTNPTNQEIKSYPRRWLVLFIAATGIFLRCFNQSCFGNINNVYVKYFRKAAWQIDWFVLAQSVALMLTLLPLTIVTKKLNVRYTLCLITASSFIGYFLTAVGHLTRNGYSIVLTGQAVDGVCGLLTWSVVPLVPAVWFPSNEVSLAVAAQIVARGLGEAAGSIIPPYIVSMRSTERQVKWHLFTMFASLAATALVMFVLSFLFTSGPPTPPSEAEEKASSLRKSEQSADFSAQLKIFVSSVKILYTSKNFVLLWFASGVVAPMLRTNNILLSSMLNKAFAGAANIDKHVGVFLAIAWLLFTVGGFIAGTIIAKTRRYKEITCVSVFLMLLSSILLLTGIEYHNFYVAYSAVLIQGFALGSFNTSIFEVMIEVTYPENSMFVAMITSAFVGCFRLLYPIVGRVLLDKVNATASNSLPVVMVFAGLVLVLFVKKDYRRSLANNEQEVEILIRSPQNSGTSSTEED